MANYKNPLQILKCALYASDHFRFISKSSGRPEEGYASSLKSLKHTFILFYFLSEPGMHPKNVHMVNLSMPVKYKHSPPSPPLLLLKSCLLQPNAPIVERVYCRLQPFVQSSCKI